MEFPPKRVYVQRLQASPAQSTAAEIRKKLSALAFRHEQMKIAYHQLHSQIKIGLLEAGEVFTSLAIPLMKLVGLKTTEMAGEGRFAAVIFDADFPRKKDQMDGVSSASTTTKRNVSRVGDLNTQIHSLQEENYAAKAETAGREILEKQKEQLIQLVHILKKIETQVNSRQNNILQTIDHHRTVLHKFFQEALYYINSLHNQNHDTLFTTLKLLRIIFSNMGEVLGSVECGVEDLMQGLTEKMCNPMVAYVNNLKNDMKLGGCAQLMSIVKDMERAIAEKMQDLEDARNRVRVAEEGEMEALWRLKETEERVRRMNECFRFLPVSQKRTTEFAVARKYLGIEASQANDEKLLWELLKKKRKQEAPESPTGPKQVLCFGPPNKKHYNSLKLKPTVSHRPLTRSQSRLNPQRPNLNTLIPLGSSPSVTTTREVFSSKRIKS